MTAQQKLEAAIRQHKRQLDLTFEQRVQAEIQSRVNDTVLPHFKRKEAEFNKGINSHNGYIPKAKYNLIRAALHPDSRQSISEDRLRSAFDAFSALERILIKREDRTPAGSDLPNTLADWDALRRQTTQARRTRRTGSSNTLKRR